MPSYRVLLTIWTLLIGCGIRGVQPSPERQVGEDLAQSATGYPCCRSEAIKMQLMPNAAQRELSSAVIWRAVTQGQQICEWDTCWLGKKYFLIYTVYSPRPLSSFQEYAQSKAWHANNRAQPVKGPHVLDRLDAASCSMLCSANPTGIC